MQDFRPTADQVLQGRHAFASVDIPAGVEVSATGDLFLEVSGPVSIAGALSGNCVAITIDGRGAVTVAGRVANACANPPAGSSGPPLTIVGDGEARFDGAIVESSGPVQIVNRPSLRLHRAAVEDPSGSLSPAQAPTLELRDVRFRSLPERAPDGADGESAGAGSPGGGWSIVAAGDLVLANGSRISAQHGGHGGDAVRIGPGGSASGGDGGSGGGVSLRAQARLRILAPTAVALASGDGGDGGDASHLAPAMAGGDRAPAAMATGGDGGSTGGIRLVGEAGVEIAGPLEASHGNGGAGGGAAAIGGKGADASSSAQPGGDATAIGGDGGAIPVGDLVEGTPLQVSEPPVVSGGNGGTGGDADVVAGMGGKGNAESPDGAGGGRSRAEGGDGGDAGTAGLDGQPIGNGGGGGSATFAGGEGGDGGAVCKPPGSGGHGGEGGDAAGGDGAPGAGLDPGAPGEVVLSGVGNGGRGGDGEPPGMGGPAGADEIVVHGERVERMPSFVDGSAGASCVSTVFDVTQAAIVGGDVSLDNLVGYGAVRTLEVVVTEDRIRISEPGTDPVFVPLEGPIAADGSFDASGTGTIGGIPSVQVTARGALVDGLLMMDVIVGAGKEFGIPITYRFSARRR